MASFSSSPATSSAVQSPFPNNPNGIVAPSLPSTSNNASLPANQTTTEMNVMTPGSQANDAKSQLSLINATMLKDGSIDSPKGVPTSSGLQPSSIPGTAPITPASATVEPTVSIMNAIEGSSKQRLNSNDAGTPLNGRAGETVGRDYVQNDVDQLQDVLGSSGVDLRAEENAMYRRDFSNEAQNSMQQAREAEEARIRSFFLELPPLSHRIHKIARLNDLSVDIDVLQHLSIASKMRFRNLMESMITASRHRQWSSHLRPPPMYESGSSAMYHEDVHDDPQKLLDVLQRVEKAQEQAARQRRMQREEQEANLASAVHHDEEAAGGSSVNGVTISGSQQSGASTSGLVNSNLSSADGSNANIATSSQDDAKRKPKKQPGISATARNMTEDKRLKLANKTAAQAMGLSAGSKAWMFGGGTLPKHSSKLAAGKAGSLPAPRFGSKATSSNASLKDDIKENGIHTLSTGTTSNEANGTTSSGYISAVNPGGWGDLAARQRHRQEEERRRVRLVNLDDAMHALEMERKGGAGRGSGSRTLYVTRALGRSTFPMTEDT